MPEVKNSQIVLIILPHALQWLGIDHIFPLRREMLLATGAEK
jgi:hypothetical protein